MPADALPPATPPTPREAFRRLSVEIRAAVVTARKRHEEWREWQRIAATGVDGCLIADGQLAGFLKLDLEAMDVDRAEVKELLRLVRQAAAAFREIAGPRA